MEQQTANLYMAHGRQLHVISGSFSIYFIIFFFYQYSAGLLHQFHRLFLWQGFKGNPSSQCSRGSAGQEGVLVEQSPVGWQSGLRCELSINSCCESLLLKFTAVVSSLLLVFRCFEAVQLAASVKQVLLIAAGDPMQTAIYQ